MPTIVNGETINVTVPNTSANIQVTGTNVNVMVSGAQGEPGTPAEERKILVVRYDYTNEGVAENWRIVKNTTGEADNTITFDDIGNIYIPNIEQKYIFTNNQIIDGTINVEKVIHFGTYIGIILTTVGSFITMIEFIDIDENVIES